MSGPVTLTNHQPGHHLPAETPDARTRLTSDQVIADLWERYLALLEATEDRPALEDG